MRCALRHVSPLRDAAPTPRTSQGCPPEVMRALVEANSASHATAYGADETTERLGRLVRRHFGEHAVAFPVFNGTGANVVRFVGYDRAAALSLATAD
jgi:threonine aldolase